MPDDEPPDVLLVEDSPSDAKLALRALARHHPAARVAVVRDGAEALEFLFRTGRHAARPAGADPRVVLLDLKLPLVGGLEVLRQVKGDPRTRALPVVVLTSSREAADVSESYRLGANSYVVKPVDYDQLSDAARQLGCYWLGLNQPPAGG